MKSAIPLMFLLVSFQGFSQASATSSVNARVRVVEPIKITKSVDLDFGNVIGSFTTGTLTLDPDGIRTVNGVQISNAIPGDVTAAEAIVTHNNNNYSISLPESFTLYNSENPNQFLLINQFRVQPLPNAGDEGSDILKIGATLNLEANQLPGFYTNSAGFNVTVSYN
ncbi:DUF4402 domain-containing protein [Gillisia sp. Q332]|uniref:DUF4402 domain-containing protein n=1 Tax=Gillisia xinjiangensis TaxID=3384765 RepID=UPI00391D4746